MTAPEPIFGILLSELSEWEKENLCWSEVQDLQQRIRARGPVSAQQQAPPEQCPCFAGDEHAYCLNRKNVHCGKAFSCILPNRVAPHIPEDMLWELLNIVCNDRPIENAEIYENMRQWICRLPSQYEHDAAIAAQAIANCNPEQCQHVIKMMRAGVKVCESEVTQARKEGYAEGAAQAIERIPDIQPIETLQNLMRTLNLHGETNVAVEVLKAHERAKEHDAQAAAAERERVINDGIALIQARIDGIFEAYHGEINENLTARPFAAAEGMDEAIKMLKTLRSQPEQCPAGGCSDGANCPDACRVKQQYCKHLKWLNQFEGGGEYRCELGNKTSDEWCYKKERCGDYELVPECGACTGPDPLDVLEQFIKENQRDLNEEDGYEPPMIDVPPFMIIDVDDVREKIAELRQQVK